MSWCFPWPCPLLRSGKGLGAAATSWLLCPVMLSAGLRVWVPVTLGSQGRSRARLQQIRSCKRRWEDVSILLGLVLTPRDTHEQN